MLVTRGVLRDQNVLESPSHLTLRGVLLIPASNGAAAVKTAVPSLCFYFRQWLQSGTMPENFIIRRRCGRSFVTGHPRALFFQQQPF